MSEELKPCPLCGCRAMGKCFVSCEDNACPMSNLYADIEDWNNRPIEYALSYEIKVLDELVDALDALSAIEGRPECFRSDLEHYEWILRAKEYIQSARAKLKAVRGQGKRHGKLRIDAYRNFPIFCIQHYQEELKNVRR